MIKNPRLRNRFLHLYNPKIEGLGSYDKNYINAYQNDKRRKIKSMENYREGYAAWFLL